MRGYGWGLLLAMMPLWSHAQGLLLATPLPAVGVADRGELVLQHNQASYRAWSSVGLTGKVTVVLHMAGRLSAKESSSAVINAITAARFPAALFQVITIVNTDDAIPGSAWFVRRSLEESKLQAPDTQFVIDGEGTVRRAWHLSPGGAAVMVLDNRGRLQFARDGVLDAADVEQVMALLNKLLG